MVARHSIDELGSDTNAVATPAHAALKDIAHTKLARDLLHINRAALVGEAGVPRDHKEGLAARQHRDDVFGHAVGKVLLLRIAAHVLEGQDCNRRLAWQREHRRRLRKSVNPNAINTDRPSNVLELLLA